MKEKAFSFLIIIVLGTLIMKLGWWFGVWPAAVIASFLYGRELKAAGFALSFMAGILLWAIWSGILYFYFGAWITPKIVQLLEFSSTTILFIIMTVIGGVLSLLGWSLGWSLSKSK